MSSLPVPVARFRFISLLLLAVFLVLQASCGSSMQADSASASEDAIQFADIRSRDYAIDSPELVRGNEYEKGHVTLDIDPGNTDPSASVAQDIFTVSASFSMGIDITSAILTYDSVDSSGRYFRRFDDCEVVIEITCHYAGAQVENPALELDYKIFVPGDHELTASIDSDEHDPDPANNSRTILFRYVASMRYLQSLLDTTALNGSITLPSGTYMGTLQGGDRLLNVHGAEDGGTVLLSDNPGMALLENIGTGSTFSNLEFRSSGAPVLARSGYNITIRDSLIAPVQDAQHELRQLFVNNSYRLLFSRVEGWGGEHGTCRSLLYTGPHDKDSGALIDGTDDSASIHESEWSVGLDPYSSNSKASGIYIQNTLFRDNACDNLLLEYSNKSFLYSANESAGNKHPRLFIVNNTFVNNQGRIHFTGNRDSDVHIRNNIFVAHHEGISLPLAINQSGEHHFVLARNLVWDSSFDSLVAPDMAAGPSVLVEVPDLAIDPLFADRAGGDFSLATGSPAIDAGATVEAYRWIGPKSEAGVGSPGPAREPTPVDGLLDGNAIMDIGAFEYLP